ncbi:glycoside hydrolase family 5 protein [Phanerochaete sordida]|uniref:Glycoside hydrolase family 5 protein n=1 Tax=Phanerochaete sordida TaxID=48140 RepID=A0A9P3GDT0_9APHY|nr:glycoside hydrolase family 5 protein [Phanerochaete sordida]
MESSTIESPTLSDGSFIIIDGERSPAVAPAQPPPRKQQLFAHSWSEDATGGKLSLHGRHFVDASGRVCSLRGVNLAGNCKTPVNDNHDHFPANHESVTYVNRPFPLEQAHEHFSRLRRWGFTFIRFLVTWEAIEHEGPGAYDVEYLQYLRALLALLPQYGLVAFVSMHQDVWSRYSGGSGAPAWTLTKAGLDLDALEETGAAWLKGVKGGGHVEEERGLWPCGYQKLAAATMATCFWAGDTFAPKLHVKDAHGTETSIQQFLQSAFLGSWEMLVKSVGDLDGVIGFEIMNEPHRGYVELQSMHGFDYNTDLHLGPVPTPLQSFTLGAGHPTEVGVWTRSFPVPTRRTGKTTLNAGGRSVWRADGPTAGQCLWEMHGVWGWDRGKKEGIVLRENYFKKHPQSGAPVDWYQDFYFPFLKKWAHLVQATARPGTMVFVEAIPNEFCPESWTPEHQPPNMVYAPHWYDLNALFTKGFGDFSVNVQGLSRGMFLPKALYWGQKGARENYALQIRNIVEEGYRSLGEKPVVIGECGIPMDMNHGEAFKTDNYTMQLRMFDAMMCALERSLVGFTLWNYNPDNDDRKGDDWNGENFSWFSQRRALPSSLLDLDQSSPTLDNGARILRSVVRPYPAKTAGIPLRFEYEVNTGAFTYEWAVPHARSAVEHRAGRPSVHHPPLGGHPPLTSDTTEIFLPSFLAHGGKVAVAGLPPGAAAHYDEARQTLYVRTPGARPGAVHSIRVALEPRLRAVFDVNDFWSDWGGAVAAVAAVVLALLAWLLMRLAGRSA